MDRVALAFLVVLAVNLLPAFGPPTWAVLVALRLSLGIAPVPLVIAGAVAAALGRLTLAAGASRLRGRMSPRRRESLEALRSLVEERPAGALAGLTLFALSPVPSAQLFVGAGLTGAHLVPLTLAFFAGRAVSYTIYVSAAEAARASVGHALLDGLRSPLGIAVQAAALAGLALLVKVDWAQTLHRRAARRASGPLAGERPDDVSRLPSVAPRRIRRPGARGFPHHDRLVLRMPGLRARPTVPDMPSSPRIRPHRVLIAGGGVAAAEAMMALADLGERRLRVELLSPATNFMLRPQIAGEPFGAPALRVPLDDLAGRFGATAERGTLVGVDPDQRVAVTAAGERLTFDELLIAVGARPSAAYPLVHTIGFGPLPGAIAAGTAQTVAVVVPPGTSWTLPAYQLALLIARTAAGRVAVVTPEVRPLAVFGEIASETVTGVLAEAGVGFQGHTAIVPGRDLSALAEIPIALPVLSGPAVAGVPADRNGFLITDDAMRVGSAGRVWAVGDAIARHPKQGGLAAQQALVAAGAIARAAGAGARGVPHAFEPVLRGKLVAGERALYLRRALDGIDLGRVSDQPLWRPEAAMYSRYLTRWLSANRARVGTDPMGPVGLPVELAAPSLHS